MKKILLSAIAIFIIENNVLAQRVGIGSVQFTPASTLDVKGNLTIGSGASYAGSAAAPTNGLLVEGAVGIGTTSPFSMAGETPRLSLQGNSADGVILGLRDIGTADKGLNFMDQTNSRIWQLSHRSTGESNRFQYYYYNGASWSSSILSLTTAGNIGIGVDAPVNKLDVEGSMAIGASYSGTNTASTNGLLVEGNVGIGTTSTGQKLHVTAGNISIDNTYSVLFAGSSDGNWKIYRNSTADFTKSLVSGASININAFNAAGEGFAIGRNGGNSYYEILGSGPTHYFRGNVGIDVTTPQNKLDVEGSAAIGASYSGTRTATSNGLIVEGNVGVGTYNPVCPLDVIRDAPNAVAIRGATTNYVSLSLNNTSYNDWLLCSSGGAGGTAPAGSFFIYKQTAPNIAPFIIDGNGNIGISTNAPKNKLDIEGAAVIGANYSGTNTAPTNGLIVEGSVGMGTSNPSASLHIASSSTGTLWLDYGTAGATRFKLETGNGYHTLGTTTNHPLIFATNNSNRMRIDNNGNVGIGNDNPTTKVDIRGTSATTGTTMQIVGSGVSTLLLGQNASGGVIRGQGGSNALMFYTGGVGDVAADASGTERMRITSAGNVGIGTTVPQAQFANVITTAGTNDLIHGQYVGRESTGTPAAGMGTSTAFVLEDASGNLIRTGSIASVWVNASAASQYPRMDFWGSRNNVDYIHMSLDHNGNLGINCTAPQYKLHVVGDIASSATVRTTNALATGAITACSDIRYKKEIVPLTSSLANILKLQGVNYKWKTEEFKEKNFSKEKQIGFIAQEMEKIYPEVVLTDIDGYKAIDYSKLTPILVEAMKEQQKIIDELKHENKKLSTDMVQIKSQLNTLMQVTDRGNN